MSITTIVITGGPSAGKTTALSWVQNAFTKLGYTVLFVPETATEFIGGGVALEDGVVAEHRREGDGCGGHRRGGEDCEEEERVFHVFPGMSMMERDGIWR